MASIARGGVAHGKDSHLCRHPVEIPHAFCDRVVGQGPAKSRCNSDPGRGFIRQRRRVRIEEDFVDRRQLTEQAQESDQFRRRRLADGPFEQHGFESPSLRKEAAVLAAAQPGQDTFEAISQDRGVGHAFTSDARRHRAGEAGLKRRKAMISGRILALTAHWHQSMKSGSRSRWTNRFRRGRGIEKCTPRSEAGLPAAMTTQPSGSWYSPSFLSSTS